VDGMSSFGAVPLDIVKGNIDFLVSSANKCLQGIPGFSYAIVKKLILLNCKGMTLTCIDSVMTLMLQGCRGRDCMVVGSMQSVPITTNVVSLNTAQARCTRYTIKFVSDLRQVDGFLLVPVFPPPIKLTAIQNLKPINVTLSIQYFKYIQTKLVGSMELKF
jgi:hypothetical protein